MATPVLNYKNNRWYVRYADGTLEACYNRATAVTLAKLANKP